MACEYSCEWGHCFSATKAAELGYVCDKPDGTKLTADGGDTLLVSKQLLIKRATATDTPTHTRKTLLAVAGHRTRKAKAKKGRPRSRKPRKRS